MNRRELLATAFVGTLLPKTSNEVPHTFLRMYEQKLCGVGKPYYELLAGISRVRSILRDSVYFVNRRDDRKFVVECNTKINVQYHYDQYEPFDLE